MGKDKGLLSMGDKTFISAIAEKLSHISSDVVIVSSHPSHQNLAFPVVKDDIELAGPAGGIHAGLRHSKSELNLIVSCDAPLLDQHFLEWLTDKFGDEDVLVCRSEGRIHPLPGIYRKSLTGIFDECLRAGENKLLNIVGKLNYKIAEVPDQWKRSLKNINTMMDYEELINEIEG